MAETWQWAVLVAHSWQAVALLVRERIHAVDEPLERQ